MKKQYIAPEITIIEIESERLLAGSDKISVSGGAMDGPLAAPDRDDEYFWDE